MNTKSFDIRLTGDTLKFIAAFCMLIDHASFGILHYYLSVRYMDILPHTYTILNNIFEACRGIGRIAFPIFAFFLVEGYIHTGNLKKYIGRMFLFALISEIPFDLGNYHKVIYIDHQNVLFTFFFGLITLYIIDYINDKIIGLSQTEKILCIICNIAAFCELTNLLHTDYSFKGIILISILYLLRTNKPLKLLSGAAIFSYAKFAPIAFLLLYLHDSSQKPRFKYFFYLFYPAHLILIYLVGSLV